MADMNAENNRINHLQPARPVVPDEVRRTPGVPAVPIPKRRKPDEVPSAEAAGFGATEAQEVEVTLDSAVMPEASVEPDVSRSADASVEDAESASPDVSRPADAQPAAISAAAQDVENSDAAFAAIDESAADAAADGTSAVPTGATDKVAKPD